MFGAEVMADLSKAILQHKNLRYLDVSSNHIMAEGFKLLLGPILRKNYNLHTLQCRKNEIEGEEIEEFVESLTRNSYFRVLSLSDNYLTNEVAKIILDVCKRDVTIEDISLQGNQEVQHSLIA